MNIPDWYVFVTVVVFVVGVASYPRYEKGWFVSMLTCTTIVSLLWPVTTFLVVCEAWNRYVRKV